MDSRRIGSPTVVMVLENAFHLGWMGATRRLFHIAGACERLGFDVAIIAGRMTNPAVQSGIDSQFPGVVVRTSHTGHYPQLIDSSNFLRRAWRAGWQILGEDVYWSKLSWGWADLLNIEDVYSALNEQCVKPALFWGISIGYLAGAVAAQRLARQSELPWIFEIHDPPRRAGLGPDNDAVKHCFMSLLDAATYVVVTADSYGRLLEEKHGVTGEKWRAVHLSYDDCIEPFGQSKDGNLRLVYAGSLSGGRSLSALVQAIAEVFRIWPEMRKSVRLDLAGSGPGFDEVAHLAREFHLEEVIRSRGVLPGNQVPEFVGSADVVIVVQAEECAYQVPGKVFESLKAGRPIMGIMPPDCEAAEILRQSGLGFIHGPQDVVGIASTLRRLWESWDAGLSMVHPNYSFISEFSLEHLPAKVAGILEGVINLPPRCGEACQETCFDG